MPREQTLTWYRLKERKPALNKVIIMKVPDITWTSNRILDDFKYVIGWMEKQIEFIMEIKRNHIILNHLGLQVSIMKM